MEIRYFATSPPAPQQIGVIAKFMNWLRRRFAGPLREGKRAGALRHKILCIPLCLCVFVAMPQPPIKKIKEFSTREVSKVSIDRLGNFYMVSEKGVIKKYDTDGNFMNEFSNPEGYPITILEPWNPLRVFVYCREQQKIILLDHQLELLQTVSIDPSLAVDPYLVSPSVNNFWILDKADFSLKKIDFKTSRVIEEVSLKLAAGAEHDFTFLREYQNQLFLIDRKSGIDILSNLGKGIHTFPVRNAGYIGFLGQEIYYLESGKVYFYDLYSEDRHELAVDPSALFVLLTDERMVLIKKSTVEVWEYKP